GRGGSIAARALLFQGEAAEGGGAWTGGSGMTNGRHSLRALLTAAHHRMRSCAEGEWAATGSGGSGKCSLLSSWKHSNSTNSVWRLTEWDVPCAAVCTSQQPTNRTPHATDGDEPHGTLLLAAVAREDFCCPALGDSLSASTLLL
ncbi:unnamed protein product, partial [Closterium sp. Naga37s-1]